MSAQEISLERPNENLFTSNQILGLAGMILSPMLFIASFFYSSQPDQPSPYPFIASLGGFLYILGAMVSATVLRNLRITGNGKGAAILYFVQMIGLTLAATFDVLTYVAPNLRETTIFFITDLAYPFSHLLMIVVGIAIIQAGIWKGWRRIPAFLVGFALPMFFAFSALFGFEKSFYVFPVMVTSGFFMLGLSVFTTKSN